MPSPFLRGWVKNEEYLKTPPRNFLGAFWGKKIPKTRLFFMGVFCRKKNLPSNRPPPKKTPLPGSPPQKCSPKFTLIGWEKIIWKRKPENFFRLFKKIWFKKKNFKFKNKIRKKRSQQNKKPQTNEKKIFGGFFFQKKSSPKFSLFPKVFQAFRTKYKFFSKRAGKLPQKTFYLKKKKYWKKKAKKEFSLLKKFFFFLGKNKPWNFWWVLVLPPPQNIFSKKKKKINGKIFLKWGAFFQKKIPMSLGGGGRGLVEAHLSLDSLSTNEIKLTPFKILDTVPFFNGGLKKNLGFWNLT